MDAIEPGDIVSHAQMCAREGLSLQRGMNFRAHSGLSIVLMSVRPGAPYADRVEDDGKTLVYEGHDCPKGSEVPNPKTVDQPERSPQTGALTQNGLFYQAAKSYKAGESPAERVRVYEKIKTGIWAYAGVFELTDAWQDTESGRRVFKFRLEACDDVPRSGGLKEPAELAHVRLIPTEVRRAVWKRDKGKCVRCGSTTNLHFDHLLPFSKGGTSVLSENVQLLCAKHNLEKRDKIE